MKIGIDIRVLMDKYYSGVSEYTANLLKALWRQEAAVDIDQISSSELNDYLLFYNSARDLGDRLEKLAGPHVKVIRTRWPNKVFNYLMQHFLAYPKIDRLLGGIDIFFSPHFNFTRLSPKTKRIITVHDLSFLRYPEFFSGRKNFWHRALRVKKILHAADKIVAVSENTKNDLIELVGIAPEKITVIYSGNNLLRRELSSEEKAEFLKVHQLAGRFVLYLGTIEPRKNIKGLIKAFNVLKAKAEFSDLRLVLAGAPGWKNRAILKEWRLSPYQNDIIFLGYISQKEKEILYSSATVFVYPSFYEGFGFPPLEALAYGLPVVCSNVSSLPEVVGEAAILINPAQPFEIASGIEEVLRSEELRAYLKDQAVARVAKFSWDKTAKQYLQLFKSL